MALRLEISDALRRRRQMAISNTLCNATPFDVEIPYTAGIRISLKPDGQTKLSLAQMEDYAPDRPGSAENLRSLLSYGCFMLDSDRSYDAQVLETLNGTISMMNQQLTEFVNELKKQQLSNGTKLDDETLQAMKESAGYSRFEERLNILRNRVKMYKKVLGGEGGERTKRTFDPERTCFASNPPREFPSKLSLQIYLAENPEIAKENARMLKEMSTNTKRVTNEQSELSTS